MYDYIKILFTFGLNQEAYQEIQDGIVLRICDLDGNTMDLPEVTESHVIDSNPTRPEWAS